MSYWEASRFKRILKLTESVGEIMKWGQEKKMELIKEKLNSSETYEGKKYSKLLIIVSGNLDEAFTVATNVGDADRDANQATDRVSNQSAALVGDTVGVQAQIGNFFNDLFSNVPISAEIP